MGTEIPPAGINISYKSCSGCRFIFTNDFDDWSYDDFKKFIYNSDYLLIDPDYKTIRPQMNARQISDLIFGSFDLSILDYGGGNGLFARTLNEYGFLNAQTFDPFNQEYSKEPKQKFDCITCFETLEHVPNPIQIFKKFSEYLSDHGAIIFSTALRSNPEEDDGVNWWYIGPRNGHISIFSQDALHLVCNRSGLECSSANRYLHIAWRGGPVFFSKAFCEFFQIVENDGKFVSKNFLSDSENSSIVWS